ncbi:MAG: hypothetical protein QGI78_03840 [Phycisphaerales bacterium]|nr:hypothetical protein [Phycisphaerales bacterium]
MYSRHIPIPLKPTCCALLIATSFLFGGCLESPTSANGSTVDQLMSDLDAAVLSEDESKLQAIITKANRLSNDRSAVKNLILSTARAKLGKIQNQKLSASTHAISLGFLQAVQLATQAQGLRIAAESMSVAVEQQGEDAVALYESNIADVKRALGAQLEQARTDIERLSLESDAALSRAEELFDEANLLLTEAQSLDAVQSLKPFKQGMAIMRKSDRANLRAKSSEHESDLIATRAVKDASAELEGIASQLNGIRNAMELLGTFRNASKEGAAKLRQLADTKDNKCATVLAEFTSLANTLLAEWSSASDLLNKSLNARSTRSKGSKQSKAASAAWKLQTWWALGQIQESQAAFLASECSALFEIIQAGIITGTSKWEAQLLACQSQLEQSIASAIQSYENAKNATKELGRTGESQSFLLDVRLATLKGEDVPIHTQTSNEPAAPTGLGTIAPTNNTTNGFNTPQELISFLNTAFQSNSRIELSRVYNTTSSDQQNTLRKIQTFLDNMIGFRASVESSFGADALRSLPILSEGVFPDSIDASSISMQGDSKATILFGAVSVDLVKTDALWLIDFESQIRAEGINTEKLAQLEKFSSAIKNVASQIDSGQITDKSQLEFALMTAMMGG